MGRLSKKMLMMVMGTSSYRKKIMGMFGSSLTAFWPLNEISGGTATDIVAGLNGTYTNCTLNQAGIRSGEKSVLFDGTTSFINIYSAGLNAALDGEFSFAVWAKVSGAGVWLDGVARYLFNVYVDANNRFFVSKSITNNVLTLVGLSGGAGGQIDVTSFNSTGWFCVCVTGSASNNRIKAYLNGAQVGVDKLCGAWTGAISATNTNIGANTNAPTGVFSGYLSNMMIFNRELTPTEVASVSNPF